MLERLHARVLAFAASCPAHLHLVPSTSAASCLAHLQPRAQQAREQWQQQLASEREKAKSKLAAATAEVGQLKAVLRDELAKRHAADRRAPESSTLTLTLTLTLI